MKRVSEILVVFLGLLLIPAPWLIAIGGSIVYSNLDPTLGWGVVQKFNLLFVVSALVLSASSAICSIFFSRFAMKKKRKSLKTISSVYAVSAIVLLTEFISFYLHNFR